MNYPVNDIYESIQGEGSMAGTPMVILRLQGCDVGCPFCDTKYTWEKTTETEAPIDVPLASVFPKKTPSPLWINKKAENIIGYIVVNFPKIPWVLITGGEPSQYQLRTLVASLQWVGKKVAIETSGTEKGHVGSGANWVTISPKIHAPEQLKKIDYRAFDVVNEIKMVVGKHKHIALLDEMMEKVYIRDDNPVIMSLQPMSQSKKATELCVNVCLERGWNLSLQIHQYLGLP